ncbi:MAG TPA: MBL fold metallo-hydrolase, partial [Firmicutes bacterium]|nr:MBL fold metallo-hydrolase [Bacillota bacterium]
ILMDPGPGIMRSILKFDFNYQKIDIIMTTHFHYDHIGGFPEFLFVAANSDQVREKPLKVIGPKGFENFYNKLLETYGNQLNADKFGIEFTELSGGDFISLNELQVQTIKTVHKDNSIGFCLIDSRKHKVVYLGDTEYSPEFGVFCDKADILLLEATSLERKPGHMTPEDAGKVAAEADAKELILVHISPYLDDNLLLLDCRNSFYGTVRLGKDKTHIIL